MIKMKKSDMVIAYSVVAIILGGVMAGLGACQMDMVDSLPLPPELPYAHIETSGDPQGISNVRFVLEWRRKPGILYQDAKYVSEEEITAAIGAVLDTWQNYIALVNPAPFRVKDDGTMSENAVFVRISDTDPWFLDNYTNPDESILIHRYWPSGQPPATRVQWAAEETTRAAAYAQAVKEIQAIRAAIKASPLYEQDIAFDSLYMTMEEAIPENGGTPRSDLQTSWGTINNDGVFVPNDGFLYEYYLGYIPKTADYWQSTPNGALCLDWPS